MQIILSPLAVHFTDNMTSAFEIIKAYIQCLTLTAVLWIKASLISVKLWFEHCYCTYVI